jgi:hypothetical protein
MMKEKKIAAVDERWLSREGKVLGSQEKITAASDP